MAKEQITIPKDVREILGVSSGDRVSFVVEGNTVRLVNSAVYAMQVLQSEMRGEAKRTGLASDEDVIALVTESSTGISPDFYFLLIVRIISIACNDKPG